MKPGHFISPYQTRVFWTERVYQLNNQGGENTRIKGGFLYRSGRFKGSM